MKKFMAECIGDLDTFKFYSGIPMSEHVAKSGDVPTSGTDKKNKMKAGLAGLEGTSLQDIEPVRGPADEDEVGDATYSVLDQSIAMLKKEGIDTDGLWDEFLENRGLTSDLFATLVELAIESNDIEEMDALLAVEGLFVDALPSLLPEGLMDLFRKKKEAPVDLSAAKKGGEIRRQFGKGVDRANASGLAIGVKTSVPQANKELGASTSVAVAPGKRTPVKAPSSLSALNTQLGGATSVARKRANESMSVSCHHNHETGGPHMRG